MEKSTPEGSSQQLAENTAPKVPAPRKAGALMGAFKFLLATKAWSSQFSILKKRGSLPLLRQALNNNLVGSRVIIPTDVIADHLIAKSIIGHRIIIACSLVPIFYGLIMLPRGLAIAIKVGEWLNGPLCLAIPVLLYGGMRAAVSMKVLANLSAEVSRRSGSSVKAASTGGQDA